MEDWNPWLQLWLVERLVFEVVAQPLAARQTGFVILTREAPGRQRAERRRATVAAKGEEVVTAVERTVLADDHTARLQMVAEQVENAVVAGIPCPAHGAAFIVERGRSIPVFVEAGDIYRYYAVHRALHPVVICIVDEASDVLDPF